MKENLKFYKPTILTGGPFSLRCVAVFICIDTMHIKLDNMNIENSNLTSSSIYLPFTAGRLDIEVRKWDRKVSASEKGALCRQKSCRHSSVGAAQAISNKKTKRKDKT